MYKVYRSTYVRKYDYIPVKQKEKHKTLQLCHYTQAQKANFGFFDFTLDSAFSEPAS